MSARLDAVLAAHHLRRDVHNVDARLGLHLQLCVVEDGGSAYTSLQALAQVQALPRAAWRRQQRAEVQRVLSVAERAIHRHRQCAEHVPLYLQPFCNRAAQAVGRKHPPAMSHEQSELICVI